MNQAEQELKRIEKERVELLGFLYKCYKEGDLIKCTELDAKKEGILLGLEAGRKEVFDEIHEDIMKIDARASRLRNDASKLQPIQVNAIAKEILEVVENYRKRESKLLGEKE